MSVCGYESADLVEGHTEKARGRVRGVWYCDACFRFAVEIGLFDD